jgi:hypothetical protein
VYCLLYYIKNFIPFYADDSADYKCCFKQPKIYVTVQLFRVAKVWCHYGRGNTIPTCAILDRLLTWSRFRLACQMKTDSVPANYYGQGL